METRPFRDSGPLLGDPAALRRRMAEDGYLFLPGLLPAEAVRDVRRRMLGILADAGMVRRDRPLDEAAADLAHFAVEPEPAMMVVLRRQCGIYELNRLQHRPELTGLFAALFDEEPLPLPWFVCRNIFPAREAFTTPPHQDFVHIQGTVKNCAAWVPLGDCEEALGPLAVAEGTHRLGLLDFRPTLGAGGLEVVGDFEGRWRSGPFRAGDVLVHNCLTVHKAMPNVSGERMRLSVDFRYQPVSEPLCAQNVEPLRNMATWEELYAGWPEEAHDIKYYWRRHALTLAPFDWSHYRRRDDMAFAMAEQGDERARSALQRVAANDPDPARRDRARAALDRLDATARADAV